MSAAMVIEALSIPTDAWVNQRVPKKLLLEQGMPTAADKRQVQDGIEELNWIAALKPINIGVPAFRDNLREYLEIAVLALTLRPSARASRLIELIHRTVPYPVVLVDTHNERVSLSFAHKRWSQGEAGKVVIEDVLRTVLSQPDTQDTGESLFLASLALSVLPRRDMYVLYQGWLDCVAALEACRITGAFSLPGTAEHSEAVRAGLDDHSRLRRDIITLRAQAEKEKQLNRRVELNLKIRQLEVELESANKKLQFGNVG